MKRGKALGPGKKTLEKRSNISSAIGRYFGHTEDTQAGGYCQLSGAVIYDFNVVAHHKTPRSELRKVGIKDLDAPHRLLILHPKVHFFWLHDGQMGRPTDPLKAERFARIEASMANAENGQRVELSDQDKLDLERFMSKWGI